MSEFESKIENINNLNLINDNKVKNKSEWNLLHDILNPSKLTKNINIHYSPIMHGCMNSRKGKAKFQNFWIWLYSGCSYTIVIRRLIINLKTKEDSVMQWHTKAGNITTNTKVKIYLTWPEFSATKIVTWNCDMYVSDKGMYDMILSKDILTALWLNIKLSDHMTNANDGSLKGSTPMVDLGTSQFKY